LTHPRPSKHKALLPGWSQIYPAGPLDPPQTIKPRGPLDSPKTIDTVPHKSWLINPPTSQIDQPARLCPHPFLPTHVDHYGRMAKVSHGLPEVLLGPAMPDPSTSCGRPPLEQPYCCFRGGHPQGQHPTAISYPLGHPTPYASVDHPPPRLTPRVS
jgi:hypothetical protein